MFDRRLKNDIEECLSGSENCWQSEYKRQEAMMIIKNRTKEKLTLLEYLLTNTIISQDEYEHLLWITRKDQAESQLYLWGFVNQLS